MYSINTYEYDCTKKCKNLNHASTITAALTKRSISNHHLAAFIAKTCRNFSETVDEEGRSALHMAASVGRYEIAEWLIKQGANINLKDKESGHTPLHRAIFYGNIDVAVLLLKYGANYDSTDNDFKYPSHYFMKPINSNKNIGNEVCAWGQNKNYNLGIGNEQGKETPENVEYFRKNKIYITQLSISTYHSIFLSYTGDVYTVGHGKGGRLVVGMNNYQQLGFKPPLEMLLSYTDLNLLCLKSHKNLKGVIAKDRCSMVYSENNIHIWGHNDGQFGSGKEIDNIYKPKPLLHSNDQQLMLINANNIAITCYTSNLVYVFCKYKLRTFKTPNLEKLTFIAVSGGDLISNNDKTVSSDDAIKVIILTQTNGLYIWYDDIQKYVKCSFSVSRHLTIDEIVWSAKKIFIVADGNLYKTVISDRISCQENTPLGSYQDTFSKKDVCTTNKVKIEVKRVPGIHNLVKVYSDEEGVNFAILQENSKLFTNVPNVPKTENNFMNLFLEKNEFDAIHDVVFIIGCEKVVAHKFIIYLQSQELKKLIETSIDVRNVKLNYIGLTVLMFEAILKFLYTNNCPTPAELHKIQKQCNGTGLKVFNNILQTLELYAMIDLMKINKSSDKILFPLINRKMYTELYDVTIKCANDYEIKAHKCVLVAKSEYFNVMFNHSWLESNVINLLTITQDYVEPIINFLYSNDSKELQNFVYSENFMFNMITICDQFLILNLKLIFEILIAERLNVKNCGEILEFAIVFNCETLEKCSLDFIWTNLSKILDIHSLDTIEKDTLRKINEYYLNKNKTLEYRAVVPYSIAIDDSSLISFVSDFKVDLNVELDNDNNITKLKTKKNKFSRSLIEKRNYEKEAINSIRKLDIAEREIISEKIKSTINEEAIEISKKLQSETEKWTKVNDKKEIKKNNLITAGLKTNEILGSEEKNKNQFINLNMISNKGECLDGNSTPTKGDNKQLQTRPDFAHNDSQILFNLSDITPVKNGKLSQKQRKRLSSESGKLVSTVTPPTTTEYIKPKEVINVWKNINTAITQPINPLINVNQIHIGTSKENQMTEKNSKNNKTKTNPIDIPARKTNLSDIMKSPSSPSDHTPPSIKKFTTILHDEKLQRDYLQKMKSKSLILTQIEEAAISDLEKFYNVDNVFDEKITIDRRSNVDASNNMNFIVWQHQKVCIFKALKSISNDN